MTANSTGAAFFDLDRTLLRGASGPVMSAALRSVGVLPDRTIPGEALVYRMFNTFGETLPAMFMTRQAARLAKGWNRSVVQEAGSMVAERLMEQVPPFAHLVMDEHRAAGRKVVIATTSPYDLVKPFADKLGVDDLIATRYGERDGAYDGTVDGFFVWGPGKLAAVREWSARAGVDLSQSWAYSDSVYDAPLLGVVRNPVAVNPDPRLVALSVVRRWPTQFFDVPAGVPKLVGIEPQRFVQMLARPELFPWVKFDIDGLQNIPGKGPAILVGNHRSYFDPLAIGYTAAQIGRPLRFLGKKEVFDAPVIGQLATAMGGIRVERGTGSDEPLATAAEALSAGELIVVMPQGTIPRGRAFFQPELKGRWGAAKLAALSHAPVIPIGLWGTEKVWPRNSRVPDVLAVGHPPKVRVRVGKPIELTLSDVDEDTKRIMAALVDLLPAEACVAHEPSPEELARSLPAGFKGDPDELDQHRPGKD